MEGFPDEWTEELEYVPGPSPPPLGLNQWRTNGGSSDQWRKMARYRFSSDRKGEHPKDHLAKYSGWMHAPSHGLRANHCRATDGYAGFEDLYRNGAIRDVACMAHVRRKFVPSRACKHALPGNGCAQGAGVGRSR